MSNTLKLYEIADELKSVLEAIEESEGEIDDNAIASLDELNISFNEKINNIASFVKNIDCNIETYKNAEINLYQKRKRLENLKDRLKEYVKMNMITTGIDKIKGDLFTVSIQKTQPSLRITNEQAIPKEYQIIKVEIDNASLKQALKEGKEIEGAELVENKALYIR